MHSDQVIQASQITLGEGNYMLCCQGKKQFFTLATQRQKLALFSTELFCRTLASLYDFSVVTERVKTCCCDS